MKKKKKKEIPMEQIKRKQMVAEWFALQSSYVWLNATRKQKTQGEGRERDAFHLIDAFGICDCKTIIRCVCMFICFYLLCYISNWFLFHFTLSLLITIPFTLICCCHFQFSSFFSVFFLLLVFLLDFGSEIVKKCICNAFTYYSVCFVVFHSIFLSFTRCCCCWW